MRLAGSRPRLLIGLAVIAVVALGTAAGESAGGRSAGPASPQPDAPRLGPVQTVDENDVGDPFVLSVPPGVAPPTGLPYTVGGPDDYVSAPWTAATSARAERNGWYVLLGTTDWQSNVPAAVSTDLVHWTQAPDALPVLPAWAEPSISMTWAPAALDIGGRWLLYYSTEDAASSLECIGRAVSDHPAGPYTDDTKQPIECQPSIGGSIDPSVVQSGSVEWLVWKNDGNSSGKPDWIWSEQLTPDGLGLVGSPHRILGADGAWTGGIIEAPAMVPSRGGGYWLFFSGGRWDSGSYGTGLAHCQAVSGPCTDVGSGPFLRTSSRLISPGGLDTVMARNGPRWAAFTALMPVPSRWHPGRVYYNRVLDIATLSTG